MRLGQERGEEVIDLLAHSFQEYPVVRYVLGEPGSYAPDRVRTLIRLFVMARILREEILLGVESEGRLVGAAIASFPEEGSIPEAFRELREETWGTLGEEARARYTLCGERWAPMAPPFPRLHLNMIGVLPELQGRGLGRSLLEEVALLAEKLPGREGVSLTTEELRNVRLYEHLGYQVTGYARVAPSLESWTLFRPHGRPELPPELRWTPSLADG